MKTLSYTSLNPQIMALRYSVRSVKLVLSVLEREKKSDPVVSLTGSTSSLLPEGSDSGGTGPTSRASSWNTLFCPRSNFKKL